MEHNFNPDKGDYKYILKEERIRQNGKPISNTQEEKPKVSWYSRSWRFIVQFFSGKADKQ